jgi:hypothetical protein
MLAGHLKMTVGEIEERMDSRELSEWLAYHRFFRPLDDSWAQAGTIASAVLLPHVRRGQAPRPADFVPLEQPPQHKTQILDVLARMKADLEE